MEGLSAGHGRVRSCGRAGVKPPAHPLGTCDRPTGTGRPSNIMDCYFHSHVPSIAACTDCRKAICATCRDDMGTCPSCRLAAKVDAASAARGQIGGTVHQSAPQPPPNEGWQQQAWQQSASAAVHAKAEVAVSTDPVESRALVALGYALWPL